jgi:LacI family transcriptional regulator, repressor for deo operon, udp, cdd, tsx, nupC, and nupG
MSSSMHDVAERAGVSITTVSRALRQSGLVSPQTTARVLAAAQELSFSVSRTASSLATGRTGRIGVLVSGHLGAWFNGSILDGIYAHLRDSELELLIYRINDHDERERFFATLPARRNAEALIVASFALTSDEQQRLQDLSMPLVYLNQPVTGAPSVSIDDVAGARTGARHLLHLGHRRIAFVQAADQTGFVYSAARRVQGYTAELDAAGVQRSEQLILSARSVTDGEGVLAQYLSQPELPTALMVESDELALSVMAACWRVGLRTPGDVSVLGFDDHAMAETFGLSTVAQPVDVLGREAAALAVPLAAGWADPEQRSSSPEPDLPTTLTVPTRLVLRDTTGRPRRRSAGRTGSDAATSGARTS